MEMVPQEAQGAQALEKAQKIGRNRTVLNLNVLKRIFGCILTQG